MAIVDRISDGTLAKGGRYGRQGRVVYRSLAGISMTWGGDRRPVGTAQGQPDVKRATKEVEGNFKSRFTAGKEKRRASVYAPK